MATKYSRQIASTLANIRKKGVEAIWYSAQESVNDPASPFPAATLPPLQQPPVWLVIAPVGSSSQSTVMNLSGGGEIPAGAELALMGNHGFTPTLRDFVTVGGVKRWVKGIDVLQPDGTPILYTLLLTK